MLFLFDIDATLISTSGVGIRAMEDAARELFGEGTSLDGIEYAGSLDPLIIRDILRVTGIQPSGEVHRAFRDRYRQALERRLGSGEVAAKSLPGVTGLLGAIRTRRLGTLGLLTGNFQETGTIKLRACGIDPGLFELAVWGDQSSHPEPDRSHLPPLAMAAYQGRFGRPVPPGSVTIIGDTPHDIRCARAHGCRSLGVGTGKYSVAQLAAAGADWAVPDLSDTEAVVGWLGRAMVGS